MEDKKLTEYERRMLQVMLYINRRLGEIRDQLAEMNGYIIDDDNEDEDDD
jgi:DNA helicase IV